MKRRSKVLISLGIVAMTMLTTGFSKPQSFKEGFLKLGSDKIHYVGLQQKPVKNETVVFIHGGGETSTVFKPLAEQFKDYNVLAIDLPGRNGSTGTSSLTNYLDIVEKSLGEFKKKGYKNFTLVGHSIGGVITIGTATKNLPDVKRAVVISGTAKVEIPEDFIDKIKYDPSLREIVESNYTTATTVKDKAYINNNYTKLFAVPSDVRLNDYKTAVGYDVTSKLKDIKIPVEVIVGDKDKLLTLESQAVMKTNISKSYLKVIPNRGHLAIIELSAVNDIANSIKEFMGYTKDSVNTIKK